MTVRILTRCGLVLFGGFIAGSRLVDAARAWREWRRWAIADPSAADLYRTDFWISVTIAVLTVSLTGLIFWAAPSERGRGDCGLTR